jgi:hypothetical protein
MTNKRAVGTLASWNNLTQAQRDSYGGGHYLTLKTAVDALPGSPTDDLYYIGCISDHDIDTEVTLPTGYTKEISVNGNGFTAQCNSTTYSIKDFTYAKVSIHGFKFVSNVNKAVGVRSVIYLFNQNVGEKCYYNNEFDINGKLDNAIYLSHHDTDDVFVYNNIIYNSVGADSGGINVQDAVRMTGKYYIEGNTIDSVQIGINIQGADTYLSNNVSTDCTVANQSGAYTDNGGNEFALTAANAFVDSASGDYTPKAALSSGVAPVISVHNYDFNGSRIYSPFYTGAIIIKKSTVNRSGKRKRLMLTV